MIFGQESRNDIYNSVIEVINLCTNSRYVELDDPINELTKFRDRPYRFEKREFGIGFTYHYWVDDLMLSAVYGNGFVYKQSEGLEVHCSFTLRENNNCILIVFKIMSKEEHISERIRNSNRTIPKYLLILYLNEEEIRRYHLYENGVVSTN